MKVNSNMGKPGKYSIQLKNISKNFGAKKAIENVSFNLAENNIYGVFGRNGAGKTTLLNILTNRIFPDKGEVIYGNRNLNKNSGIIPKEICYMPEKHYFPYWFKVKTIITLAADSFPYFDDGYAFELCRNFDLNTNQSYNQLSRGFQSILRIVIGLAAQSPITIFDEPVLGLDAVSRDMFYEKLVEDFSAKPRIFIIATHLIEEASDLFNEAIIIKQGKLIMKAAVDEILENTIYVSGKIENMDNFLQGKKIIRSSIRGKTRTALIEEKLNSKDIPENLNFSKLNMQNLFIQLTGGHEKEEDL